MKQPMKQLSFFLILFSLSACKPMDIGKMGPQNYSLNNSEEWMVRSSNKQTQNLLTPLIYGTSEREKNIIITKMTFEDRVSPRKPSNLVVCLNSHTLAITKDRNDLDCDTITAVKHDPYRAEKENMLPPHEYWRVFETDAPQFAFDAFRYTYPTDASDAMLDDARVINAKRWINSYFFLNNLNTAKIPQTGDIVYAGHFHFVLTKSRKDGYPTLQISYKDDFTSFQSKIKELEKDGILDTDHQLGNIPFISLKNMLHNGSTMQRQAISATRTTRRRY